MSFQDYWTNPKRDYWGQLNTLSFGHCGFSSRGVRLAEVLYGPKKGNVVFPPSCPNLPNTQFNIIGDMGGGSNPEMYDPETNTWSTLAAAPLPRGLGMSEQITVGADRGKILMFGGVNQPGIPISSGGFLNLNLPTSAVTSMDLYDPATDVWETLIPTFNGISAARATLPDGRILICGGTDAANAVYAYLTAAIGTVSRDGSGVVTVNVANGFAAGQVKTLLPSADANFPAGPKTIVTRSPTQFTYNEAGPAVASTVALFYGSISALGSTAAAYIYDPFARTLTAVASMATKRSGHACSTLADGRVLVAGGLLQFLTAVGAVGVSTAAVAVPVAIGDLARDGANNVTATVPNSYAVGQVVTLAPGEANFPAGAKTITAATPTSFTYSEVGAVAVSTVVETFTAAAVQNLQKTCEIYDPVANTWTAVADMPLISNERIPGNPPLSFVASAGQVSRVGNLVTANVRNNFEAGQIIYQQNSTTTAAAAAVGTVSRNGSGLVTVTTLNNFFAGQIVSMAPGEANFPSGNKTLLSATPTSFTYQEAGAVAVSTVILTYTGTDFQASPKLVTLASLTSFQYIEFGTQASSSASITYGGYFNANGISVSGTEGARRAGGGSVLLPDGRVLVVGGLSVTTGTPISAVIPLARSSCLIYDVAGNKWEITGSIPNVGNADEAIMLQDGNVFVAGGIDESFSGANSNNVATYNTPTGQWFLDTAPTPGGVITTEVPIAAAVRSGSTVTVTIGNNFLPGMVVTMLQSQDPNFYLGSKTIATATPTSFTYTEAGPPVSSIGTLLYAGPVSALGDVRPFSSVYRGGTNTKPIQVLSGRILKGSAVILTTSGPFPKQADYWFSKVH